MSHRRFLSVVVPMVLVLLSTTATTRRGVLALDQTKKETVHGASRPRSQVVLRVENYRYEAKNKGPLSSSNSGHSDEELKMVLLQELHEEETISSFGDDDGGDGDMAGSPYNSATATTSVPYNNPVRQLYARLWSRLDEMDRMIVANTLPLAALTCIIPLVASSDLFWVNQLGDALAVSAQSSANMVYHFSFGMFSFLPSVTATLVSQHYANGDVEGTQTVIGQSLLFAMVASAAASSLLFWNPSRFLGAILQDGNPALALSIPYLRIRCLSLMPQMVSFVAFSAFRGTMDLKSCVKISVLSNALNMALTPILIHVFRFGVAGSAITALICDCLTALSYIKLMSNRQFLIPQKILTMPSWASVAPLVKGSALQARSFALQITNILVARKVQSLGSDGVAPAAFALAIQTFFMGSVVIYAMGMATQTLYPTAIANSPDEHRSEFRQVLVRRLLSRGFRVGLFVSFMQCLLAPGILRSTPLETVRQAAIFPILVVIAFQGINGLAVVGEGIIIGSGKFALASSILVMASMAYIGLLQLSPSSMGINGVFFCMAAYNALRLFGVLALLPFVTRNDNDLVNDSQNEPQNLYSNSTTVAE